MWQIRPYKSGDKYKVLQLIRLAFKWSDEKYWKWRYIDNPTGVGRIWIAEDDDRIVGHYAMIPGKIKVEEMTASTLLTTDIVTHSDYRRQGIFEALAKKAYSEIQKEGNYIQYVFPNELSYPKFIKKLGFSFKCVH